MIVDVEGWKVDLPDNLNSTDDLIQWCQNYFNTSQSRHLDEYYERLESRYARMGMGRTSLAYRSLKEEVLEDERAGVLNMAAKFLIPLRLHHHRLYHRYVKMGRYHEADRHYRLREKF